MREKEQTTRDQALQDTEASAIAEGPGVPPPSGDGGEEVSGREPACAGCFACTNCIGNTKTLP